MLRSKSILWFAACWLAVDRLLATDPGPTQPMSTDGNPYAAPIPVNDPFPDSYYGADHGGSSLTLTYPFSSPFGYTDHSRGVFVYECAPFTPRGSEGVFGMDVWLEQQNPDGSWSPIAQNNGWPDKYVQAYQPINTPNPGPSLSYTFTWTYEGTQLPPYASFRVFVYVYIYNQGGGSQGDYPIYSSTTPVGTGSANDPPRIAWAPSNGNTNPSQFAPGQTYIISANAQDDNGNLVAVSINKNGQPFAYAGASGSSGNSQNPTSDPQGTVTYTAWATDSYGAQSPTITWTVQIAGQSDQAPVGSSDATLAFSQAFTPAYSGGSGTGGWQFCVADYTNWDGGASAYIGTNLGPSPGDSPGAVWVASWNPPAPGDYAFYVARDGDADFNPSAIAGPYLLSVTPLNQTVAIAPASSMIDPGQAITFGASGGVNGYVWSGSAAGEGSSQTITFTSAGTYTVYAYSPAGNGYAQSNLASAAITVDSGAQSVALSPQNPSVAAGGSIQFTASGGQNGYVWGGAASGSGSSQLVGFPNVGSYQVTVYSPAGGNYAASNTALATVAVVQAAQTVLLTPANPSLAAGQSVVFTASGGMNGYVWSGAASGTGSSQTVAFPNPGSYTVTVSSPAGGNFAQGSASATVVVAGAPAASSAQVIVVPEGGSVKVENRDNLHNSQILVPYP